MKRVSFNRSLFVVALVLFTSCQSAPYQTRVDVGLSEGRSIAAKPTIDPKVYQKELEDRVHRIAEFEEIRKWAKNRGVRVWLGGGSATGIASYVREELEMGAAGKGRFPYTYFDIYRSTQDADIVIDGGGAVADELEVFLKENLGYLQGSKRLWEVRLLREARGSGVGKKDPIIGSSDFRNQNTDSYSTALVEITDPPRSESRVRDAFDWDNSKNSPFLVDLLEGKVTFYRNPQHAGTWRARQGWNPEIISVVRAYTKAAQYDGEIRAESLVEMEKIISDFNPNANMTPEASRYLLSNANKLFQHSRDVEATWNWLEKTGLRKKIITFANRHGDTALATLMNREPLRSFPLGKAPLITDIGVANTGKTARELNLGDEMVAHETSTFLAYENITMSRTGKPNLFVSRNNAANEAAVYGDGAYTAIGRRGARGTGLTIRFRIHPDAVCGRDFFVAGSYVIFRNANALTTIPEDKMQMSLQEFMQLLDEGRFSGDDLGVMKKLELKMLGEVHELSDAELDAVFAEVRASLRNGFKRGVEPASFAYFLRLAGADPRLKRELARDVISNTDLTLRQRFDTLNKYGFSDLLFDADAVKGMASEAFDLQTMAVLNSPNLDPKYIRFWGNALTAELKRDPAVSDVVFLKLKDLGGDRLEQVAVHFTASGHANILLGEVIRRLRNGQADAVHYRIINRHLTSLGSIPDSLEPWATNVANKEKGVWAVVLGAKPGNEMDSLRLLSAMTERSEIWLSEWAKAYSKAAVKAKAEASAFVLKMLQKERGPPPGLFESMARVLYDAGLKKEVADQAIAKLETARFFNETNHTVSFYFSELNRYLEELPTLTGNYKKWALDKRNWRRGEWLVKTGGQSGEASNSFRKLCDSYSPKTGFAGKYLENWRKAFVTTLRESPAAAKRESLLLLQRASAGDFSVFATEISQVGFEREVVDLAVAKLATAKFMRDSTSGQYFYILNNFLGARSTIPAEYAKWALAKENPRAKDWASKPVADGGNVCFRLLRTLH